MPSTKSSLTIAIPTYNRALTVSKLAQSVLNQLQPDEELLVVDDGSLDETSALLATIPGVRLHQQIPNQGMVKTWNACLRLASNEWICIIHDDDLLCDGALQTIRLACLTANEPALITHQPLGKDEEGFIYRVFSPGSSAIFCSATGTIPSGAIVHRQIVQTLGGFDEELMYSADIEYFARINAQYKLLVIESPEIVRYQVHNDNYQYKTWLKADFFPQLLEIEKRVVQYSGLAGAAASARLNERVLGYLLHITKQSERLKNKVLMRKYGLLLWQEQKCRRRTRLAGLAIALKSWLPIFNSGSS